MRPFAEFGLLHQIGRRYKGARRHREAVTHSKRPILAYQRLLSCAKSTGVQFESETPVFILSSSWRAGSTLLQRFIASRGQVLVWGEPFDNAGVIQRLASSFSPVSDAWPPARFFASNRFVQQDAWIANLYPNLETLLEAHSAFLKTLFIDSAHDMGFQKWGLKEVRFGTKEVLYLKLFFPNAKFIFLKRNLGDAYESYKAFAVNRHWYDSWPDRRISGAYQFARHHARLSKELSHCAREVNALEIEYEKIVSGNFDLDALERHCDLPVEKQVLERKIGGSRRNTQHRRDLLTALCLYSGSVAGRKEALLL